MTVSSDQQHHHHGQEAGEDDMECGNVRTTMGSGSHRSMSSSHHSRGVDEDGSVATARTSNNRRSPNAARNRINVSLRSLASGMVQTPTLQTTHADGDDVPPPFGANTKQLALTGSWALRDVQPVQTSINDHEKRLDSLEICVAHLMEQLERSAFLEELTNRMEARMLEKIQSSNPHLQLTPSPTPPPEESAIQDEANEKALADDDDNKSSNTEDDDHEANQKHLTEDTFSFILSAKTISAPFFLGLIVVALQVSIFILVGVNTIEVGDSQNPFQVPINVSGVVRLTQLVAILIAVLLQHDLFTCFDLIRDGFNVHLREAFPNATFAKFLFGSTIRFFSGSLCLILMFVLIVQSESVIDVFLNFTAVEFVSQFDEAFFYLASQGFIGKSCEDEAEKVAENTYYSANVKHQRSRKALLMVAAMGALLGGWGILIAQQKSGKFVCSTIYVQFGDDMITELGPFSGLYDKYVAPRSGLGSKRVEYIERKTGRAKFAYCNDVGADTGAWTFRWYETENPDDIEDDPCDWVARSSPTETYDLTETTSMDWFIQDEHQRIVLLEPFHLSCNDCNENDCHDRGECDNGICTCESGYTGVNCEFLKPCETLSTDVRAGDFPGERDWATKFELLKHGNEPVLSYHRPVYVHFGNAELGEFRFDVIFFTGRRWVASHNNYLPQIGRDTINLHLSLIYFFRDFHGYYSKYKVDYISEPMDIGTENDAVTPIGIPWADAGSVPANSTGIIQAISNRPVKTVFLCSFCDETNYCRYDGVCNEGACSCSVGTEGSMCEKAPLGNGHCDPFFNIEAHNYDGGDCCSFSCQTGPTYTCGMDTSGYIPEFYPFCQVTSTYLWKLEGEAIQGQQDAEFGHHIALSESGNILLVMGSSYNDGFQIYDKDGRNWKLRTEYVPAGSEKSAREIQLVEGKYRVKSKHSRVVPVTVTFFLDPDFNADVAGQVRVLQCGQKCTRLGIVEDVWYADLSRSGTFAIATGDHYSNISGVELYESMGYSNDDLPTSTFWETHDSELLEEISISDDGRSIALLVAEANETDLGEHRRFIKVFSKNQTEYLQRGESIFMDNRGQIDTADFARLALSANGNIIAIAQCDAPYRLLIYAWIDGDWVHHESPPIGTGGISCLAEQENEVQPAMTLSGYGTLVFTENTKSNVDNSIFVFNWTDVGWGILGRKLPGGPYSSLATSSDGYVVATGSPLERADGVGLVYVYSRPKTEWCPAHWSSFRLSIVMDEGEGDTRWFLLHNETGKLVLSGRAPYTFEPIVADTCLEDLSSNCYELVLFDEYNEDGIAPPGGYSIILDGEKLEVEPYDHGPIKHVWIGKCEGPTETSDFCEEGLSYLQVYASPQDSLDNFQWSFFDYNTDEVIMDEASSNRIHATLSKQAVCLDMTDRCFVLSLVEGPNEMDLISDSVHIELNEQGLEHDHRIHEERLFLGENKCCPAGLTRFSAMIRVCETATWTISTMAGEIIVTGSTGDDHFAMEDPNATTTYCNPHTDPVDIYYEDLCLDQGQCYNFSFLGDHSGAALSTVMPYSQWLMASHPGGAYFGYCENNNTIDLGTIHLYDGVSTYGQATNEYFSPQYSVGPINAGRHVNCKLEGKVWGYSIETRYDKKFNATLLQEEDDEHISDHEAGTRTCNSGGESSSSCTSGDAPPGGAMLLVTVESGSYTNMTITCTSCSDLVSGWHSQSSAEHTCDWFRQSDRCELYGDKYPNFGYSAKEACCSCGGGTVGKIIPTLPPKNETLVLCGNETISADTPCAIDSNVTSAAEKNTTEELSADGTTFVILTKPWVDESFNRNGEP